MTDLSGLAVCPSLTELSFINTGLKVRDGACRRMHSPARALTDARTDVRTDARADRPHAPGRTQTPPAGPFADWLRRFSGQPSVLHSREYEFLFFVQDLSGIHFVRSTVRTHTCSQPRAPHITCTQMHIDAHTNASTRGHCRAHCRGHCRAHCRACARAHVADRASLQLQRLCLMDQKIRSMAFLAQVRAALLSARGAFVGSMSARMLAT